MHKWEKLNEVGKSNSATFIPSSKQPSHVLDQTLDQKQTIVFLGEKEQKTNVKERQTQRKTTWYNKQIQNDKEKVTVLFALVANLQWRYFDNKKVSFGRQITLENVLVNMNEFVLKNIESVFTIFKCHNFAKNIISIKSITRLIHH